MTGAKNLEVLHWSASLHSGQITFTNMRDGQYQYEEDVEEIEADKGWLSLLKSGTKKKSQLW